MAIEIQQRAGQPVDRSAEGPSLDHVQRARAERERDPIDRSAEGPSLDDRYTARGGRVLLSGIQALVRLLLEQRRLDERRALRTGVFVSGYPGSPLGGLDLEIARARRHLEPAGVVFRPGLNEELAATAVGGTQLVGELPGRRLDGVVGFWHGKSPGLDRAADAIRHANVSGTSHLGGAVALIGNDPTCKSSTLPSSCGPICESLVLPLLSPAGTADIVRLGLHAVAMSRRAGLWTALQVVADVADSSAVVALDGLAVGIPSPPSESRGGPPVLLGASSVAAERDLLTARLDAARDYGRQQGLNRIVFEPARPREALVAPGPAFAALLRALELLGLEEAQLDELGTRLVRIEMPWPLHPDDARRFARGVEELLVVEDKRPFVERQLRDLLYSPSGGPRVLGKRDAAGRVLVPVEGAVDADALAAMLAERWAGRLPEGARRRLTRSRSRTTAALAPLPLARTPYFCSGCPHNLSTRSPADQLVGIGIGCHTLVAVDSSGLRGRLLGAPQMGGEGAQWIGMAPFTRDAHYVQNLGDGTFFHSGSLAIRAAVAAGVDITFRLLYNDAIAMTGGQRAPGRLDVADVARLLAIEGVRRIIVTGEDPDALAREPLPAIAEVRHRRELRAAQEELAKVGGVTVLLHTDRCANEERRLRKRGKLPEPAERVWINERVCEGCGDCGRKSSCLSVVPVETELGRRTRIHQSSCTQDLACLEGDCPSFVLVRPTRAARRRTAPPDVPFALPEPVAALDPAAPLLVRMPGTGGTGVLTVSQILQMGALIDGRWASGLDQTGVAQKGGPVISDVRIASAPSGAAPRAGAGEVDLLLGLDPLGAVTPQTLRTLDPERTIAVVNTHLTPTASMVVGPDTGPPPLDEILARIASATRADRALWIDAGGIVERLLGDHMPANILMLGAAYQHGCIPVRAVALEQAIRLNGTAVEASIAAFRWGRAAAVDPEAVAAALGGGSPAGQALDGAPPLAAGVRAAIDRVAPGDRLRRLVERRAADLQGYQSERWARRYVDDVLAVLVVERERLGTDAGAISEAYACGLHKLMAYKDEYEVARLHLDALEVARREQAFGAGARADVLLQPPLLRAMGLDRKIRVGRGARPLLGALRAARRLRGTPLDPFGQTSMRRLERELIDEYRGLVRDALERLSPQTQTRVAALAALPEMIRGYEQVKLAGVERFRATAAERLAELSAASAAEPGRVRPGLPTRRDRPRPTRRAGHRRRRSAADDATGRR